MLVTFEEWTDHTQAPKWAKPVAQIIWDAKPDFINSARIEGLLGISGATVRQAIHYLRCTIGAPIASQGKPQGYMWAQSPSELNLTIKHGQGRINSIANWVDSLRGMQESWPAQQQEFPL